MKSLILKFANIYLKQRVVLVIGLWILIFSSPELARSQTKWDLNLRPAANFPTKKLGDATLNVGFGFEGTIAYWFFPNISVSAGWGWNKFQADNSFAGNKIDVVETGYRLSLQFRNPIGNSKLKYLVGAGALFNHIEIENQDGSTVNEYLGHDLGWQVEGGIIIPLSERFNLTPTVRYQSLPTEIKIANTTTDVDLNYFSISAALSWSF